MTNNEALKQYVKQLREFKDHLNKAVNEGLGADDNEVTMAFLESDFTISFMGKSVTLGNGAEVFQSIEELINYEIEEWEE
jgi:hypothetical protein